MKPPSRPAFVSNAAYRRRRLRDAARFLPFLSGLLFLMPLVVVTLRGAGLFLYLFLLWALLVLAAGLLARQLAPRGPEGDDPGAGDRG